MGLKHLQQLLYETVEQLHDHNLFHPLSPHLCLTFAQHAHHLGLTSSAIRYYKACRDLINSGSELSLIAQVGLLAVQNKLEGLEKNAEGQDEVNALAEKCKGSSSAMFSAAGYFLASLTDDNRVNSKWVSIFSLHAKRSLILGFLFIYFLNSTGKSYLQRTKSVKGQIITFCAFSFLPLRQVHTITEGASVCLGSWRLEEIYQKCLGGRIETTGSGRSCWACGLRDGSRVSVCPGLWIAALSR